MNEVTLGSPPKVGLLARRTNSVIRGLKLLVPPSHLLEGLGPIDEVQPPITNCLINSAYLIKILEKIQNGRIQRVFRLVNIEIWGEWLTEREDGNSRPFPLTLTHISLPSGSSQHLAVSKLDLPIINR